MQLPVQESDFFTNLPPLAGEDHNGLDPDGVEIARGPEAARGAYARDGQMVDEAVVRRARRILHEAQR